MRLSALFLVIAAVATTATVAEAQPALRVGERVRVATADGVLTGRVVVAEGDTLIMELGPLGPVPQVPFARVSYGDIESVDVRVSHSRWRGAAIGGAVGAGAVAVGTAAIVGFVTATEPGAITIYIAAIGVAALIPGAVVGAALGALTPGARWEPLPPGRLSLAPTALGRGGGGVSLRVRF